MKHLCLRRSSQAERGQVLPLMTILMVVMLMFAGLAIDLGFAYITKANLSKAVDAAALAGMRNLSKGQAMAASIAQSTFAANYKPSGRDVSTPVPSVTWTTNAQGLTQINISATTSINTYFARVLPQFATLTVGTTAQSTRANVAMTLVLDRSRSMTLNGGSTALPLAVAHFLADFSDTLDQVALATFASNSTLDVSMRGNFTSTVTSAVNGINFDGGTYAQGGLLLAQTQEAGVSGLNILKAVVFFTDGWANTNLDNLQCSSRSSTTTLLNYGGCAPPEAAVGWCGGGVSFWTPGTNPAQYVSCNATSFPAQQPGNQGGINDTDVSNEANYRAIQLANTLRASNVVVYAVGLGDKINSTVLQQIANDPSSPTYDYTKPQGLAVIASYCPGPTCTADLDRAFQAVATDILLRLTK